jgi:hypothetical protein
MLNWNNKKTKMIYMLPYSMAQTFWKLNSQSKAISILYFIPLILIILWKIITMKN